MHDMAPLTNDTNTANRESCKINNYSLKQNKDCLK